MNVVGGYVVPTNKAPTRLVNSLIVTSHIVVYGFTAFSVNVATQYVLMYDGRDLPAAGAVPILSLDCQTNTLRGVSWLPNGREFFEGIVLVTSSAAAGYTANATADTLLDVQFDFID